MCASRQSNEKRLRPAARLHGVAQCARAARGCHDLLLRLSPASFRPVERVDRPEADLLLDDLEVVARAIDPGATDDVGELAEVRHVDARHVDRRHDLGRRRERPVRVALEHFLEDRPIERVVARLFLGDVREHRADRRLVLARELAGIRVADLRRALLQRRVDEHAVRVLVPRRLEARLQVLELHLLEHGIIEDAAVARVVVQNRRRAGLPRQSRGSSTSTRRCRRRDRRRAADGSAGALPR